MKFKFGRASSGNPQPGRVSFTIGVCGTPMLGECPV